MVERNLLQKLVLMDKMDRHRLHPRLKNLLQVMRRKW